MDQDILYKKIIEQSNKNRKTLINIHSQISAKKKNAQQQETVKYQNYMKEYDELVKFNKESEQENYRLKKELALIDIQIEELSFRNKMSKSRIKDQNDQIQNIKDETFDIDKQKRKRQMVNREYEELKAEKKQLQRQISHLEDNFDSKRKKYNQIQQQYHQKMIKKQYLFKLHRQNDSKNQALVEKLEQQLKSLKKQVGEISVQKIRQEKTHRNTRSRQVVNQIKEMLMQHKSTYNSHQ